MTFLEEYWELIKSGQVIVGRWLRKEIRNLINDLQDPRFIYDPTEAHKRIKFQETLCFQSKAPYYMKPLVLMPWQKAWWEAVYSFKMADTGLRRFTEGLLEIARKNGKSTMFAGDCMYDLFFGEGIDVVCASNDDAQSRLVWREVKNMKTRLDPKNVLTSCNLVEIRNDLNSNTVTRLSTKVHNKDGRCYDKSYLDESHDINEPKGNSEIAEACARSMSTKDDPLFLGCSTQGFNRDCYLDKKIDYAKKVISGEIDNIHFIAFLFEQDSEQEVWQDRKSWEKSNPAIRYGVKKTAYLERDLENAKHDKATRIHMLVKDFNIPQATAETWLMLEDYDYKTADFDLDQFRGSLFLGAVDLSATTDLSSAKALLMLPESNTKFILSHYWIPRTKLELSPDKDAGAEYEEWSREGYLTINDDNEVDISQIADWFFKLYQNYHIRPYRIGYDQRYAKTFIDRCEDYGFETEMLLQGDALSGAMKLTESDLKTRKINYNQNPIDKWCLKNCCAKPKELNGVGTIQPVKIPGQPHHRIDGALTFIMVNEMYRRHRTEFIKLIKEA